MAKSVTTQSGRDFLTIKDAQAYYRALRETLPLDSLLPEPDRSDILDIYRRYCAADAYPMVAAVNVTTKNETRAVAGSGYVTTKAFAVLDAAGAKTVFSVDKALSAVAV